MLLRNHPLMMYEGIRSWPPAWFLREVVYELSHPLGAFGILKDVLPSTLPQPRICFLTIEHCNAEYVGALLLSDPVFCREIWTILIQSCGKTIREIGGIDLSYTL